jgi:hypothetical protein
MQWVGGYAKEKSRTEVLLDPCIGIYYSLLSPKIQTEIISDISLIGLPQSFFNHSIITALMPFR